MRSGRYLVFTNMVPPTKKFLHDEVHEPATQTLSVKVPAAMKRAVDMKAKSEGMSTSSFVRTALARALL